MKRRTFLQTLMGSGAALFAGKGATMTMPGLLEQKYAEPIPMSQPQTLDGLRLVVERCYKSVRPMEDWKVIPYRPLFIIGKGNNEREAVADAFKTVRHEIGGEELVWRSALRLDKLRDFDENTNNFVVRGRAMVR